MMDTGDTGLYIHVPFCLSKCNYCSFNSYPIAGQDVDSYVAALIRQLTVMAEHPWCQDRKFTTLYVGGGTPTTLGSKTLTSLVENCLKRYRFIAGPEITVETNPNTLTREVLHTLYGAGINRLSIGVQSFSDRLLRRIGRSHSSDEACRAVECAVEAGFSNINIDLIYGLPGQSLLEWQQSLTTALSLGPTHLALYELMVEEKTPLAEKVAQKSCVLPNEDEMADMEELTEQVLAGDFHRYEISNYARTGHECRHNIQYWRNRPYLGAGAGAVSFLNGIRIANVADPGLFSTLVARHSLPVASMESLCRQACFRESVIMGLRMTAGVSTAELQERFGLTPKEYYGGELMDLMSRDLLEIRDGRMRLSLRALPVANQVLARLV